MRGTAFPRRALGLEVLVAAETAPVEGLSEPEAARRLAARGPAPPPASSRSTASIVRANVLTVFNLILVVFGVLTLAFGAWQDALFLGILVANSTIGIAQELRAKRALDRLAALVAPQATVVRDGDAAAAARRRGRRRRPRRARRRATSSSPTASSSPRPASRSTSRT